MKGEKNKSMARKKKELSKLTRKSEKRRGGGKIKLTQKKRKM